jgi:hypothetical protein
MKKIYLILILFTFISTSHAQLIRGYGFKIGATLASEDWDYSRIQTSFNPDSRWGLNLGVFGEFLNLEFFSIVMEFNYVQKGRTVELPVTTVTYPDGTGEYFTWDTRVDYYNLSVLGKLRFEASDFVPYILIGAKVDFEINRYQSQTNLFNLFEQDFNEVLYGIKAGAGSEFNFYTIKVLAEILYDYNFTKLYKGEYLTVSSDFFDFRIGILF